MLSDGHVRRPGIDNPVDGTGQIFNERWIEDKERGRVDGIGRVLQEDENRRNRCCWQEGNIRCYAGRVLRDRENRWVPVRWYQPVSSGRDLRARCSCVQGRCEDDARQYEDDDAYNSDDQP